MSSHSHANDGPQLQFSTVRPGAAGAPLDVLPPRGSSRAPGSILRRPSEDCARQRTRSPPPQFREQPPYSQLPYSPPSQLYSQPQLQPYSEVDFSQTWNSQPDYSQPYHPRPQPRSQTCPAPQYPPGAERRQALHPSPYPPGAEPYRPPLIYNQSTRSDPSPHSPRQAQAYQPRPGPQFCDPPPPHCTPNQPVSHSPLPHQSYRGAPAPQSPPFRRDQQPPGAGDLHPYQQAQPDYSSSRARPRPHPQPQLPSQLYQQDQQNQLRSPQSPVYHQPLPPTPLSPQQQQRLQVYLQDSAETFSQRSRQQIQRQPSLPLVHRQPSLPQFQSPALAEIQAEESHNRARPQAKRQPSLHQVQAPSQAEPRSQLPYQKPPQDKSWLQLQRSLPQARDRSQVDSSPQPVNQGTGILTHDQYPPQPPAQLRQLHSPPLPREQPQVPQPSAHSPASLRPSLRPQPQPIDHQARPPPISNPSTTMSLPPGAELPLAPQVSKPLQPQPSINGRNGRLPPLPPSAMGPRTVDLARTRSPPPLVPARVQQPRSSQAYNLAAAFGPSPRAAYNRSAAFGPSSSRSHSMRSGSTHSASHGPPSSSSSHAAPDSSPSPPIGTTAINGVPTLSTQASTPSPSVSRQETPSPAAVIPYQQSNQAPPLPAGATLPISRSSRPSSPQIRQVPTLPSTSNFAVVTRSGSSASPPQVASSPRAAQVEFGTEAVGQPGSVHSPSSGFDASSLQRLPSTHRVTGPSSTPMRLPPSTETSSPPQASSGRSSAVSLKSKGFLAGPPAGPIPLPLVNEPRSSPPPPQVISNTVSVDSMSGVSARSHESTARVKFRPEAATPPCLSEMTAQPSLTEFTVPQVTGPSSNAGHSGPPSTPSQLHDVRPSLSPSHFVVGPDGRPPQAQHISKQALNVPLSGKSVASSKSMGPSRSLGSVKNASGSVDTHPAATSYEPRNMPSPSGLGNHQVAPRADVPPWSTRPSVENMRSSAQPPPTPPRDAGKEAAISTAAAVPLTPPHTPPEPGTPSPAPSPQPLPAPGVRLWRLEHVLHRVVDIIVKDREHDPTEPPTLWHLMRVNRAAFCATVSSLYSDILYTQLALRFPVPAVSSQTCKLPLTVRSV